jgi:hypothetical protein
LRNQSSGAKRYDVRPMQITDVERDGNLKGLERRISRL